MNTVRVEGVGELFFSRRNTKCRLDFRRLPGPVLILPRGMSAGSFSRTAAGNRAYTKCHLEKTTTRLPLYKRISICIPGYITLCITL